MSPLNAAANRRPTAPGGFSACSAATFATQASDPRALECLRHGAASACGNGVVEPEYGEECDCGGSAGGDVCLPSYGSHRDDPHCDASTCLFKASAATEAPPPPLLSPPPLTYEPHAWCDSACGVAREKGASPFVTDVPPDKCLRCAAGYLEEDCGLDSAPYKGWVDDGGGVRETRCAWTGCVAGNATSVSCPTETTLESEVACETAPGGEPGVNIKCCAEEPEWECCGVLECRRRSRTARLRRAAGEEQTLIHGGIALPVAKPTPRMAVRAPKARSKKKARARDHYDEDDDGMDGMSGVGV